MIGKASSAAAVTVNGGSTSRLDEYFHKEVTTTNTGKIHIPYSATATDGSGTTNHDSGKFLSATPEVFGHDFDGNLISDGRFNYTWDAENRLIAMETHATVPLPARRKLTFAYDFMGRRIRKTVWHGTSGGGWQLHHKFDFIHELGGWNILAERSGGSNNSFLRTYTWGTDLSGNLSGAGGVGGLLSTKFHTSNTTVANGMDLNGDVTLLVNTATGQSAATYEYGPFGEPLRQSDAYAMLNPFRFSTKYTDDETGLVAYEYRDDNPSFGTWLSRDPLGDDFFFRSYTQGLSIPQIDALGIESLKPVHNFVCNNPVNQTDMAGPRMVGVDVFKSEIGMRINYIIPFGPPFHSFLEFYGKSAGFSPNGGAGIVGHGIINSPDIWGGDATSGWNSDSHRVRRLWIDDCCIDLEKFQKNLTKQIEAISEYH